MNEGTRVSAEHQDDSKTLLGFWIYLMTDCVLFATLFATYAVLRNNTFGGPAGAELFNQPYVLLETLVLLTSSFTCGLMILALKSRDVRAVLRWLIVTFLLGALFLGLELNEFALLIREGETWQQSAFLSAFFTLVGTHGLHITAGLLWAIVLGTQLMRSGITAITSRRLMLFSLFWHFLDVIWIFIFTFVFLMGEARL